MLPLREPPLRGESSVLLEQLDERLNVHGVEFGARNPPRREVGDLIRVNHTGTDERGESMEADAEVLTRLLAGQHIGVRHLLSLPYGPSAHEAIG